MIHIELINDYKNTIFYVDEDGTLLENDIKIVKKDPIVKDLEKKIGNLYDSYYDFQTKEKFFPERERAHVGEMLEIISKLKARLDQINDGSYDVYDYESERIKKDYPVEYELFIKNKR